MLKIDVQAVENAICEVAATEIMPRFRNLQQGDISYKIGDDPVTIADKAAEKALSTRLLALLPGSKVVGEEAFAENKRIFDHFDSESPVWIIDPIDGTRNFVAGRPSFGVIVALVKQNQTLAGWLYDPTSDEFVTAQRGAGAFYKNTRLKVRAPASLKDMFGGLGSRFVRALNDAPDAVRAGTKPRFVAMDAGCHQYPQLAVDGGYFTHPDFEQMHFRASRVGGTPWDDAAGILIHAEAGGYAAHWNGDPVLPYFYDRGFCCAPDRESWQELKNWIQTFCNLKQV